MGSYAFKFQIIKILIDFFLCSDDDWVSWITILAALCLLFWSCFVVFWEKSSGVLSYHQSGSGFQFFQTFRCWKARHAKKNILTKWPASKYISFKPKNQISWFVPLVQPCLRFVIDFICVQLMIQLEVWCLEASADLKLLVKVVWIKGDTELNMPREMTLHCFMFVKSKFYFPKSPSPSELPQPTSYKTKLCTIIP